MATHIEPCPFCQSMHQHITQNGVNYCVVCQSCKAKGPHRNALAQAIEQWNRARSTVLSHPEALGNLIAERRA